MKTRKTILKAASFLTLESIVVYILHSVEPIESIQHGITHAIFSALIVCYIWAIALIIKDRLDD